MKIFFIVSAGERERDICGTGISVARRTMLRAGLVLLSIGLLESRATEIRWAGSASGYWNTAANWVPAQVPTTNDIAVITNAGTYTVTLNVNPVIAGLELGGMSGTQTVALAERTLVIDGPATIGTNAILLLSGGWLSGNGPYEIEGSLEWMYGGIESNAVVNIEAGGLCKIASVAQFTKVLKGSLQNAGTLVWQQQGGILLDGILHNTETGLIDLQYDSSISMSAGGAGTLVNDGLMQKTAGAGNINVYPHFTNNGTLDVQSGSMTLLNGGSFNSGCAFTGAGSVYMTGGTMVLSGNVHSENLNLLYSTTLNGTASVSGTMYWGGGTIGSNAVITIATNGYLQISSGPQFTKILKGCLLNAGTLVWQQQGGILLDGILHNEETGLVDLQYDSSISMSAGGAGTLINDGLMQKTAGAGTINVYPSFTNNGAVDVQSGTLTLLNGSMLNEGCAFTGAGITRMTGGTNVLCGIVNTENLYLMAGATLVGTGTVHGTLHWDGGTIGSNAVVTVETNATLSVASDFQHIKVLHGTLNNSGTVKLRSLGNLELHTPLYNPPGGLIEFASDNVGVTSPEGVALINEGLLIKSAGTIGNNVSVPVTNSGIIRIQSGKLNFQDGFGNPGGAICLKGGNFQCSESLKLQGGRLEGWGTVYAAVENSGGTVQPSRTNGLLTISGNYLQALTGETVVELDGTVPGTDQGQLRVTGQAQLRGTLSVIRPEGFIPAPGTNFTVLTYASHTGVFDAASGFYILGHDCRLATNYTATALVLETVSAPDPTNIPVTVSSSTGTVLIAWPAEFEGYSLYWKTNLLDETWLPTEGSANRLLELPPLPRNKFYRLF